MVGFLSGLSGNIAGCLITQPEFVMGTDSIVFGLFGSMISFFVYNWAAIKKLSNNGSVLFCYLLIYVFMIIFLGISNNMVFRIGGALMGILIGTVFCRKLDTGGNGSEQMPTGWRKYCRAKPICGGVFAVVNVLMIILLFAA